MKNKIRKSFSYKKFYAIERQTIFPPISELVFIHFIIGARKKFLLAPLAFISVSTFLNEKKNLVGISKNSSINNILEFTIKYILAKSCMTRKYDEIFDVRRSISKIFSLAYSTFFMIYSLVIEITICT